MDTVVLDSAVCGDRYELYVQNAHVLMDSCPRVFSHAERTDAIRLHAICSKRVPHTSAWVQCNVCNVGSDAPFVPNGWTDGPGTDSADDDDDDDTVVTLGFK